jgi:hypothetical protein
MASFRAVIGVISNNLDEARTGSYRMSMKKSPHDGKRAKWGKPTHHIQHNTE